MFVVGQGTPSTLSGGLGFGLLSARAVIKKTNLRRSGLGLAIFWRDLVGLSRLYGEAAEKCWADAYPDCSDDLAFAHLCVFFAFLVLERAGTSVV